MNKWSEKYITPGTTPFSIVPRTYYIHNFIVWLRKLMRGGDIMIEKSLEDIKFNDDRQKSLAQLHIKAEGHVILWVTKKTKKIRILQSDEVIIVKK